MTTEKGQMTSIRNNLNRSNEEVRKEIYRALGEESGIDVHVHEGIVRLTGVVDTEESLDFIETTVRELPGVDDVENELTVKIVQ
jgi:osmotically-inducible protein OsmY